MKDQIAFIFARGGSKGIPNKNIKLLAGKPLISYSITAALSSKYISKVIVSTDSSEIAKVAEEYGAVVLWRPEDLTTDESPEIFSWKHAIKTFQEYFSNPNSIFISLPATSPLRASIDINSAIEYLRQKNCDIVFGITPSNRNPFLNMAIIDKNDHIKIVNKSTQINRRQDAPSVYDITTCVYACYGEYILNSLSLMEGKVGYVLIPPERAIDIDDPFDFYLAELILKNSYENFLKEF